MGEMGLWGRCLLGAELTRDLGSADASTTLIDRKHGPSSGADTEFGLRSGFVTYSDRFMPESALA